MFALHPAIPRRSSASPTVTWSRFHVSPSTTDLRITPFEPDAQTTDPGTPLASGVSATLTPRRLVSIPLVCSFHHCACTLAQDNRESRNDKGTRIAHSSRGTGKETLLIVAHISVLNETFVSLLPVA